MLRITNLGTFIGNRVRRSIVYTGIIEATGTERRTDRDDGVLLTADAPEEA